MLKPSREYTRKEKDKDATIFYIFCEGIRTEPQYFFFFAKLNSRIKFEIIPPKHDGNNSPDGLYKTAKLLLLKTEENPNPKYELSDIDQVWFVIDTDQWGEKTQTLRENSIKQNWFVAQSNPSFEIWHYYHFFNTSPLLDEVKNEISFKSYVNSKINGGFNCRKHPENIRVAVENSISNFSHENNEPKIFSTNVHDLAQKMLPLVEEELDMFLSRNQ